MIALTLTIYPTTDDVLYFEDSITDAGNQLTGWADEEGYTLELDPECEGTNMIGYFVRDANGRQVAAATITE